MRSKESVLIVIGEAPQYGGGENIAVQIADHLSRTKDYSPILCTLKDLGGAEYDYPAIGLKLNRTLSISALFKMIYIMIKYRVKIVHAHGYMSAFYSFFIAKLLGVKKLIWHFQSIPDEYFMVTRRLLFLRMMFRLSSDVIACSKAVADVLINQFKLGSDKLSVIYNGINDPNNYKKEKVHIINKEFSPCLGMTARFDGKKGHDVAVKAVKLLSSKYPDVGIIFSGDGPNKPAIEELVAAEKCQSRVIFTGLVEKGVLFGMYGKFDLMVLPSIMEAVPISIMEAMMLGVPVVASSVGGIPEIIDDGVNGLLVPPNDAGSLAQRIAWLWENPQEKKKIIENARIKATRFTLDRSLSEIERIYQ
jgi:glycosyltransferase involved in cell wall biosynthesis